LPRPSAAVEITCFVAEFIVLKYHSEKFLWVFLFPLTFIRLLNPFLTFVTEIKRLSNLSM
jgi:hypothetical protein